MNVSVVVTTKNEALHIENCLRSVKEQAYAQEKIEIIVVDNGSTDTTKHLASLYTQKVYDFGPERSAQRNFGIKKAQGEYILYLDADMILSKRVIWECVEAIEKNQYSALYLPEHIVGKGFWIKVRNFERKFYNATVIDCVRFVRKESFVRVNGFDESLTGPEDWDFDRRIRAVGNVGIIAAEVFHDEGVFDLKCYLRKKGYYAQKFDAYVTKWGKNDPVIKKQLGFFYRYIGVFCEKGKWSSLAEHPVLALGMYLLRGLVGAAYLARNLRSKA